MGSLSLILLISFPFLALGNYPMTFFDSSDGTPDIKTENYRVQSSQNPYFAVFTPYNKQPVKTYHQPPAPAYQAYNSVPSYNVTPYHQHPQNNFESAPKVSPNIPIEVQTTSPTTTKTTSSPTSTTTTSSPTFTTTTSSPTSTTTTSSPTFTTTTSSPTTTTTTSYPTTTTTTPNLPVKAENSQYQLLYKFTPSNPPASNTFISPGPSVAPQMYAGTQPLTPSLEAEKNQYHISDNFTANQFDIGTERLERSLNKYSGGISPLNQPAANIYLPPVYRTEPTTTTEIVILPPTFKEIYGFNLAEKTRQEANALLLYLSQLDQNERASNLINANIETNACLNSIKDMMNLLEGGARIVESAGTEFEQMIETVNGLRNERNITLLVRGSADLLIQLDNVLPRLQTFTSLARCRSYSSSDQLQALRDQAQILYRLSFVADFKFTQSIKDNLLRSAIITEVITNFLDHLRDNVASLNCFTQKDFLGEGTLAAAQIMDDLAEALGVLGYFPSAKEARQYASFTRSIAVSLGKLKDFEITDDCRPGALRRAAGYLNDLANLINEVGLVELGTSLGLVFRFDLLP